jgi:transcriptional regulator with XRE-family HTH domain
MSPQPNLIREMIETRNLPIEPIAIRLGVSPSYLRDILNGSKPTSATVLARAFRLVSRMNGERRHADVARYVAAGVTVFLTRRGYYRSTICTSNGGGWPHQQQEEAV